MDKSFALFKRIHTVKEDSNWVGYWIFKWKWFEIFTSKDDDPYPRVTLMFMSELFYFLRLNIELRYRE